MNLHRTIDPAAPLERRLHDPSDTPRDRRLAAAALAVALGYATLRYNVFKQVPWADWATYTANKAFGVAALALVAVAAARIARGAGTPIRALMAWSGGFTLAHVLLSLMLLGPVHFPRYFDGAKLTAIAGWSLAFAAGATVLMDAGARRGREWHRRTRVWGLGGVAALAGLHAALPAIESWFAPATWPGGMLPLTLLSAVLGAAAVAAGIVALRALPDDSAG